MSQRAADPRSKGCDPRKKKKKAESGPEEPFSTLSRGNPDYPRASIVIFFVATPTMESRERYQELCRLCASYDAVKMDIFGQEGKNRQLVDKIQACLPFKVGICSFTRYISYMLFISYQLYISKIFYIHNRKLRPI